MNLLPLFENSNFPLQCGSVGLVHTMCEVMKGGRAMLAHDAAVRRVIFEVDIQTLGKETYHSTTRARHHLPSLSLTWFE
jgi:hypothetical protein